MVKNKSWYLSHYLQNGHFCKIQLLRNMTDKSEECDVLPKNPAQDMKNRQLSYSKYLSIFQTDWNPQIF